MLGKPYFRTKCKNGKLDQKMLQLNQIGPCYFLYELVHNGVWMLNKQQKSLLKEFFFELPS